MLSQPLINFTAQAVCLAVLSQWRFLASSVTYFLVRLADGLSTQPRGSNVVSSSWSGPWPLDITQAPLFLKNTFRADQTQFADGSFVKQMLSASLRSSMQPGSTDYTPKNYWLLPPGTLHRKTWLNRQSVLRGDLITGAIVNNGIFFFFQMYF